MADPNRREFFKSSARGAVRQAVGHADAAAGKRARRWIRPPYALNELEFLLACDRCGDCVEACPHQVIFPLPSRLGPAVSGTPALDLVHKGCHLCADWPCVAACAPLALKLPDEGDRSPLPRIAIAVVDEDVCLPYLGPECGACANSCPVPGAMTWHNEKPEIEPRVCVGCGLCREACIVEPSAIGIRSRQR